MTNRPHVMIELDKPRCLVLDFNALALIEEKTGKNAFDRETWKNMSASNLRIFVWACLRSDDPELTLEQVGAMLHPSNIRSVIDAIQKLMDENFSDDSKKQGNLPIG